MSVTHATLLNVDRIIAETVEQELPDEPDQVVSVQLVIDQMNVYLETEMTKPELSKLRALCINKDSKCAFWASLGGTSKSV